MKEKKQQEISPRLEFILKLVVGITGFTLLMWAVFTFADYRADRLVKIGKHAVAEVETLGIRIKVKFHANGQLYTSKILDRPYQGIRDGEKFEVIYDENNISDFLILYHKPVINEKKFIKSKSTYIDYAYNSIIFEYEIRDTIYHRIQNTGWERLSDKYRKANAKYLVKYKKDNPIIGYLYLDSLLHN